TCQLLAALIPKVEATREDRRRLVLQLADRFQPLADDIGRWRASLARLRPAQLLKQVLDESGLEAYYRWEDAQSPQPKRLVNLKELLNVFARKDRRELDPVTALERLLLFASLARNVDRLDPDDERVRVITVHQAKGLEFDAVFVA